MASTPDLRSANLDSLLKAELTQLCRDHGLPTYGLKSQLIARLLSYRETIPSLPAEIARQAQQPSPAVSRSRSQSPTARTNPLRTPSRAPTNHDTLELTVRRLVENSMQGMEERLRSSLRPLAPSAASAAADNISLPSPLAQPHTQPQTQPPPPPAVDPLPAAQLDATTSTSPAPHQPPLPEKVKQKILRGEYIDFDTLLPESLYPARHGLSPSPSFTLRLSSDPASADGDVVIAQQKPLTKRTIRDLPSWMEAWNVFIHVLVAHSPARALPLLAYQRIICDASLRFSPRCWLRYDQRFRATAAADKTLRWDCKHNDLWLECFTQPLPQSSPQQPASHQQATAGGKPRRPCTYCGGLYHYPENCPSNPFRRPRQPTSASSPSFSRSALAAPYAAASTSTNSSTTQPQLDSNPNNQPLPHYCRDFNRGNCRRRSCRFRHLCTKCNSGNHGEKDCPPSL